MIEQKFKVISRHFIFFCSFIKILWRSQSIKNDTEKSSFFFFKFVFLQKKSTGLEQVGGKYWEREREKKKGKKSFSQHRYGVYIQYFTQV